MCPGKAGVWVALAAVACGGCGSQSSQPNDADAGSLPATLALTADWLHHTVSLVDFDALVSLAPEADAGTSEAGASDASAPHASSAAASSTRIGEIDLGHYAQAPYSLRITPDGATAIVSMSAGFFTVPGAGILVNTSSIPTGSGEVLLIDIATRSVVASLDTGADATGIAITHDGGRAFVCHAGASSVTIIDVAARKILQQVDLGGTFAEEISLDDSGTVGIVTYLDPATNAKNARTFAVADMASTLSAPIPLDSDAAGVPFFPGSKVAYVVLAYNPLTSPSSGYALVDATSPSSPVKLVETKWTDATYVDYQAIPYPAHGTVLVPVAAGNRLTVREYALGGSDVVLQKTYDVAPTGLFGAFGAVVDARGRMALSMPAARQLAVLDLASGAVFTVPWFPEAGPLGIALR
jgi:DNA-binding beta-propeller fold protein YncE